MWNPLTPRKTFKRRLRATELHLVDLEGRYSALENRFIVHQVNSGAHGHVGHLWPDEKPNADGSDSNC